MNGKVLTCLLTIALLCMSVGAGAEAAEYSEGDVEQYILKQMAAASIPGMSISIATSQKEVYSAAFGDVSETTSDLYAGALTKTFTAVAIGQLAQKGDVKYDDEISKYTDVGASGLRDATVESLLHFEEYPGRGHKLVRGLEKYAADESGGYMSVNAKFEILADIVEKASGMDYAEYIRKNIIDPLDMRSTYTVGEAKKAADVADGYRNYFGLPIKKDFFKNQKIAAKKNGIVSDVKDLNKYMRMYLQAGGEVLEYDAIEAMMDGGDSMGTSVFGTPASYYMGFASTELDGEKIYYCSGSDGDYTSAIFIAPASDIGVAMLFDTSDALVDQKFTDMIEAGAVSLILGKEASDIGSVSYITAHATADIIYLAAIVLAAMPLFLMEAWIRWAREKFSYTRIGCDILVHLLAPTALIFIVPFFTGPWRTISYAATDLFFVSIAAIGLLYVGGAVKAAESAAIYFKSAKGEVVPVVEDVAAVADKIKDDIPEYKVEKKKILKDEEKQAEPRQAEIPEYKTEKKDGGLSAAGEKQKDKKEPAAGKAGSRSKAAADEMQVEDSDTIKSVVDKLSEKSENKKTKRPRKYIVVSGEDAGSEKEDEKAKKESDVKKDDRKKEDEKKPDEKKPDEKKLDAKEPDAKGPDEKETGSQKSNGQKSNGQKPNGQKSNGQKSSSQKASSQKANGQKASSQKANGQKLNSQKSNNQRSNSQKSNSQKAGGKKAGSRNANGQKAGSQGSNSQRSNSQKSNSQKAGGKKTG